jgi:alanine racemase
MYTQHNLIPSFINPEDPEEYVKILGPKVPLKAWIKVETGLGRCGVFPEHVINMIQRIIDKTPYQVEGIYSHIGARASSSAPNDLNYCEWQWARFRDLRNELERLNIKIPYYQLASSHACTVMPHTWLNCVSIGNALYADPGTAAPKHKLNFLESYRAIRSKLISVKPFKAGDQIGGVELKKGSIIGVAPIGLGDGLSSKNSGHSVLVKGVRANIIGSVSLEHIRIDITDVPGASVGDEVTILGMQGHDAITFNEMCDRIGISKTEMYTSINQSSVPYVYFKNGRVFDIELSS